MEVAVVDYAPDVKQLHGDTMLYVFHHHVDVCTGVFLQHGLDLLIECDLSVICRVLAHVALRNVGHHVLYLRLVSQPSLELIERFLDLEHVAFDRLSIRNRHLCKIFLVAHASIDRREICEIFIVHVIGLNLRHLHDYVLCTLDIAHTISTSRLHIAKLAVGFAAIAQMAARWA